MPESPDIDAVRDASLEVLALAPYDRIPLHELVHLNTMHRDEFSAVNARLCQFKLSTLVVGISGSFVVELHAVLPVVTQLAVPF